jgi:hypothetical protein
VLVASYALARWIAPPNPRGNGDPLCPVIGLLIVTGMIAGAFRLGQRWRTRRRSLRVVERGSLLTVISGAVPTLVFDGAGILADRPNLQAGIVIGLLFLALLAACSASPWWVFRPADGG